MSNRGCIVSNLCRILFNGIKSVQPESLFIRDDVIRYISVDEKNVEKLQICGETVEINGKLINVIGFGKAVVGMAKCLERVLDNRLKAGILSVPVGAKYKKLAQSKIRIFEGAENNLPDEAAMETALKIKKFVQAMNSNDVLIVLISGGGSALLPLPISLLTLSEKLSIIRSMVAAGATIQEVNTVRIALSQLKGGKLAQLAERTHKIFSLIISDIVGDPVELIASGPTAISTSNQGKESASFLLKKFNIWDTLSDALQNHIKTDVAPTLASGMCHNNIIGSNKIAAKECYQTALSLGYLPFIISTAITGQVKDVTACYINFLKNLKKFIQNEITKEIFAKEYPFEETGKSKFFDFLATRNSHKPLCFIMGGETTVEITGDGVGGRNQELALRISVALHENPELKGCFFLSAGTDGIDGPTPAAGAIGCQAVVADFLEAGTLKNLKKYLARNDSYNFYKDLNGGRYQIVTGHTGTNVMDLHLFVVDCNFSEITC